MPRFYLPGSVVAIGAVVIALQLRLSASAESAQTPPPKFGRLESGAVASAPASGAHGDSAGGFERARAALQHAMAAAETIEVFEGLPGPIEKEVLAAEKRKPTRQFDGEWFYAAPQPVAKEMRAELEALLAVAIAPYRGVKLCGGFHADYGVRWTWNKGDSTTLLLLCFGCNEARVLSGGRWTTDLRADDAQKLRKLFAAFQKERPAPDYRTKPAPPAR